MNLLELQTRANLIVDKVNAYEANLPEESINENDTLNQHLYADLFCLRPVLNLIFGADITTKLDRSLEIPTDLRLYASNYPVNQTTFNINNLNSTLSMPVEHYNSLDMMNQNNMMIQDIKGYDGSTPLLSANIADALLTESQVANVMKWNTTDQLHIRDNTTVLPCQSPGIVCYYLGNDYDGQHTATVPLNPGGYLNNINYNYPPLYGAFYKNTDYENSQVGLSPGHEAQRLFIPSTTYTAGKLISPQQIWQPSQLLGEDNVGKGFNYQGQALYHELVFRSRRSGITDTDFIESSESDNDPQGLATRLVLAKQKQYYVNRPWFNELNELSNISTVKLADTMLSPELSDTEFYNNYKLKYIDWLSGIQKNINTDADIYDGNNTYKDYDVETDMSSIEYQQVMARLEALQSKLTTDISDVNTQLAANSNAVNTLQTDLDSKYIKVDNSNNKSMQGGASSNNQASFKFFTGHIINHGMVTCSEKESKAVTFPEPYKLYCRVVVTKLGCGDDYTRSDAGLTVAPTTTGFTYKSVGKITKFYYIAFGY